MHRLICSGLLAAGLAGVAAAPAAAQLTDIRTVTETGEGRLWLAFATQPASVEVTARADGAELVVTGVSDAARTILPVERHLVAALVTDPGDQPGTLRIRLQSVTPWDTVSAELRQGGVLVTLTGDAITASPATPHPAPAMAALPDGMTPPGPAGTTAAPDAAPDVAATPDPARVTGGPVVIAGPDGAPGAEPDTEDAPAATSSSQPAPPSPSASQAAPATPPAGPAACAEQSRAAEADPWDDEVRHAQAACLADNGAPDRAAEIYEQMLAFEPENFRAIIALAGIREAQGDRAAAVELYDQAASHAISDAEAARARARLRELRNRD